VAYFLLGHPVSGGYIINYIRHASKLICRRNVVTTITVTRRTEVTPSIEVTKANPESPQGSD